MLADEGVPVVEFRASIVIGSGSTSFEMIRNLVEKLPMMTTPRWVRSECPADLRRRRDRLPRRSRRARPAAGELHASTRSAVPTPPPTASQLMRSTRSRRGLRRIVIPVPSCHRASPAGGSICSLRGRRRSAASSPNRRASPRPSPTTGLAEAFPPSSRWAPRRRVDRASWMRTARSTSICWSEEFGGAEWTADVLSGRAATSTQERHRTTARPRLRSNPSPVSAVGTAGMPSTRSGTCAASWTCSSAGLGEARDGVTSSCSSRATISNGGASSRSTRRAACDFVPRWSCPDAAGSSTSSARRRRHARTPDGDLRPQGTLRQSLYWYSAAPLHHFVFNGTLRGIAEQCLDAANGGGRSSTVAARSPWSRWSQCRDERSRTAPRTSAKATSTSGSSLPFSHAAWRQEHPTS